MTKIEHFAKTALGITLTPEQLSIVEAVSEGKVVLFARPMGQNQVRVVIQAWIKQGLREQGDANQR